MQPVELCKPHLRGRGSHGNQESLDMCAGYVHLVRLTYLDARARPLLHAYFAFLASTLACPRTTPSRVPAMSPSRRSTIRLLSPATSRVIGRTSPRCLTTHDARRGRRLHVQEKKSWRCPAARQKPREPVAVLSSGGPAARQISRSDDCPGAGLREWSQTDNLFVTRSRRRSKNSTSFCRYACTPMPMAAIA